MSKLILDKSDPDIAEATKDCKVGDTKTFEVTVEITRDDAKMVEGDVTDLAYSEGGEEPETEEAAPETEPVTEEEAMPQPSPQSAKLKY